MSWGWNIWTRFWFEAKGAQQFMAFRRLFSFILFLFVLTRTPDLELFYGESGWVPSHLHSEVMDTRFRYSPLLLLGDLPLPLAKLGLWSAHIALLVCLAVLFLRIAKDSWARLASVLAFILHVSFLHRNMSVSYGADLISTFFLFYSALGDPLPTHVPKKGTPEFSDLGSVAFRLSQLQLCIIYAYSGLEKLKGVHWWKGEAIWDVLANAQLARWDFSWVATFPLLIVGATYATLLWEVYFPVLVWFKPIRPFVLAFGVMLHLGIGVSMNIPYFSALMVSTYLLFLDAQQWKAASAQVHWALNLVRHRVRLKFLSRKPIQ